MPRKPGVEVYEIRTTARRLFIAIDRYDSNALIWKAEDVAGRNWQSTSLRTETVGGSVWTAAGLIAEVVGTFRLFDVQIRFRRDLTAWVRQCEEMGATLFVTWKGNTDASP